MPLKKNAPTRWVKSNWTDDDLNGKKVFASFTINEGGSYEGTGEMRARQNPDGEIAVELVFERYDSPYHRTDFVYFLSAAQLERLTPVAASKSGDIDFQYEGQLVPDNSISAAPGDPDAAQ